MDSEFVHDTQHARYPVAVHVIISRIYGRVLLMRRDRTDYGGGRLAFPAGHVDLGETVTECVVREIEEELCVILDRADLTWPISMFRRSLEPRVDYFLVATRWQGDPSIREPHKCTELVWADPARLPDDALDYVGRALDSVAAGRVFDEFGWEPVAEANGR